MDEDAGKLFDALFHPPEFRLWNARVEEVPWDRVQGLLLSGGCDVTEEYLKHQVVTQPEQIIKPEPLRDAWDFAALARALETGLPVLAICRGHQVLNVALGGTLHLDIPNHGDFKYQNVQTLRHSASAEIRFPLVNSSHHQAIDKLGDGLEVEAWFTEDEVIEQVRLKGYPFVLGAQYHPERDAIYATIFAAFVSHLR